MSKVRDNARRNARERFATTRRDGSPVGSRIVAFSDGCIDGVREDGTCFTSSFTSDHSEADHTPWMKGPFSYEQFEEMTRVDDYGWDD